jgi:PHD/YefM family antitoxin component YafN of YafNO toxin-antitoxin module
MSPQLIINEKGKESGVILSLKDYNKLKEMAEDLADIKAYDKAKAGLKNQRLIPLQDVIKERKQNQKNGK